MARASCVALAAFILTLASIATAARLPADAAKCPRPSDASNTHAGGFPPATASVDRGAGTGVLSNGFACALFAPGRVSSLRADFAGGGVYGGDLLANDGVSLEAEDADGHVASSAALKATDVAVAAGVTSGAGVQTLKNP